MTRHHPFEEAEVASLELMPLDLRRRLDLAGLHVSLATWQALPLATRERWCDAPVRTTAEVDALAAQIQRDCEGLAPPPRAKERIDPSAAPWSTPAAGRAVAARAAELGFALSELAWAELPEPARYALHRMIDPRKSMIDPRKSIEKLEAALVVFGVRRSSA